ncbi:MAG TPA: VOC family protein [Candidatus Paceibacterota bacterium]|nr:VOC family protein [Candidatus Paceibacterota bacterium]
MKKMNPVVHFEMGYKDKQRMVDFYTKVFGWQAQMMGPEMGNYVVATTSESDKKTGRPKQPGAINGGFYKKTENSLSHAPSVVVAVDDIRKAMKSVEAAGGKILGAMDQSGKQSIEPQEIPGVGLWISAMDTEDNRFSILQPAPMMDIRPK